MRRKFCIPIMAIFALLISVSFVAEAQQKTKTPINTFGPGPVVSISESYASLPQSIQNFLATYFPGIPSSKIELNTLRGIYNIELMNGYELKFNKSGNWIDIEGTNKTPISPNIIQALVPANTYNLLVANNAVNNIKEMQYNPEKGYKITMRKVQVYFFDAKGNPIQAPKQQWDKRKKSKR